MHSGIRLLSALSSARFATWAKTFSLVALAGALVGCSSDEDGDGGGNGGTGGLPNAVLIEQVNNYTSTTLLEPPIIETASGADLRICWPNLTIDMQCHDMELPEDIDLVELIRFGVDTLDLEPNEDKYAAVARRLTADELPESALDGIISYQTDGETCADLSQLTNFGTPVNIEDEYVEAEDKVYVMIWASGTVEGHGTRAIAFLNPTPSSFITEVTADFRMACNEDGEGILEFTAEFHEPLVVPAGKTLFNWRNVELNGLENELVPNMINRVLLARYESLTPDDLETRMFDLELLADDLWEFDFTGGFSVDVRNLQRVDSTGRTDEHFEGFDAHPEGNWLLGMQCTDCQNPAPLILTVLEPE
jgi:hypothetical protein